MLRLTYGIFLLESGRTFGFGMLLSTVAALDHILNTAVSNAITPSAVEYAALRDFVRRWISLRKGSLAPERLQDFVSVVECFVTVCGVGLLEGPAHSLG